MSLNAIPEFRDGLMSLVSSPRPIKPDRVPFSTFPLQVYATNDTVIRKVNTSLQRPRHVVVPLLSRILGCSMPGYHHDEESLLDKGCITEWWKKVGRADFPGVHSAAYTCLLAVRCPQALACISLSSALVDIVERTVSRHGRWHRPTILRMGHVIRGEEHYMFLIFSSRASKAYADVLQRPHVPAYGDLDGYEMVPVSPAPKTVIHVDEVFAWQVSKVIRLLSYPATIPPTVI